MNLIKTILGFSNFSQLFQSQKIKQRHLPNAFVSIWRAEWIRKF